MTGPTIVLAFPGQGSLVAQAGMPWRDEPCFDAVRQVGEDAGVDVVRLLTSSDVDLVSTENAQLATFALSICILDATGLDKLAELALGHSLGEYTALVGADVVPRGDGARLVAARGAAMRDAALAAPGGLVAMLGGDLEVAEAACAAVAGASIANVNGPGQIVLGGAAPVVDELVVRAKELGFRRAIPLKVGGAFHTPLMAPAAAALRPALEATTFQGRATVVANVDGAPHRAPGEWPDLLVRQLTEPVRFDACVAALPGDSVVVECGPGAVLQGLIARIRTDLDVRSIGVPEDLSSLEGLG